jgi:energy-coupling factor transporter transmembrane protein EcfT
MHQFLAYLEDLSFSHWVKEAPTVWAFPTILVLHTIGMGIVAGGAAMLSLILLGFWPSVPKRPFARVFPYLWAGFAVNAVTGTMMLIADATTKLTMLDFYIKMGFVFAGLYFLIRMRRQVFDNPKLDEVPVPGNAKMLAWASLACWFGAITAGRLMAYVM